MEVDPSLRERAAAHHALSDPVRLGIVDLLAIGDRSPGELAHRFGLGTNLLAHHLGVLRDAGLVVRARSHADGRRAYVRLRPEGLAGLGPTPAVTASRVVFVCTRNAARSPLAAAVWQRRSALPATSAGTHPGPRVNPRAVAAARRHGLRLERDRTAHVDEVVRPHDLVVAVCDRAHEELGPDERRVHWSVPDPGAADTEAAFEDVLAQLTERVDRLAAIASAP
ncbi:arsenate reductase/protein-tyrosine-phosphatase family protein [Saccharothrix algeriensis]|uniref:Helix-turn-helix domain-containing protein n=1 Tax=Saccharothrix algeriensis TaxID=173560 RepID=A0A8T8HVN1_9PSEU|nr:helix-turn-helix domain-containing protein [Saccharothrix algeriensis]MBM7814287.1 protein-tyrosine-phosphatase/DNA-binding HxlR family transcriptional regulator [Saccharothrix algeriensis]QTR02633.1 helix-turn-helix domain-containing protein [Saccharothrix algeriensis]